MLLGFGKPFRFGAFGRWISNAATSLVRAFEDGRFEPRIVAEFVLVAALVFGRYLVGRFSASDGIRMADDNCFAATPAPQRPPALVQAPRPAAPPWVAPPLAAPPATAPPAAA